MKTSSVDLYAPTARAWWRVLWQRHRAQARYGRTWRLCDRWRVEKWLREHAQCIGLTYNGPEEGFAR